MLGRADETELLDSLLRRAAEGHGGGVVLHGEPGIGKTALLSYAEERAAGFQVLRAVGVEPEADLAYATLHQLLMPVLGSVGELPGPQAQALNILFGRAHGGPPDPFLVGLAGLSLLSLLAGERPVLCVVDDAHWADQPTLKTLAFVARRLDNEPVALMLAARADEGHGTDLPHLRRVPLMGLGGEAATALLAERAGGRRLTDGEHCHLLAATGGNPLALLELAGKELPPEGAQEPPALTDELRRSFLTRVRARHAEALPLLQLVAADGSGSVETIEKAAVELCVGTGPLHRAELDELLTYDGPRLMFRHPLMRSAIYHSATPGRRAAIHRALAAAFDAPADQHRRAWHRGQAATGHDEEAAELLERSAEQAALRGGPAAAMAALSRAAELTAAGPHRGRRLWTAARAALRGGFTATAGELLDRAEREPHLDEVDRISVAAMRAVVAEFTGSPEDAMDLIGPWIPRALRVDRRRFTPTIAMYGDLGIRTNRPRAWSELADWLDAGMPEQDGQNAQDTQDSEADRNHHRDQQDQRDQQDHDQNHRDHQQDIRDHQQDNRDDRDQGWDDRDRAQRDSRGWDGRDSMDSRDSPEDAVLRLLRAACLVRAGHDPGPAARDAAGVDALTDPITMTLAGAIARGLGDRELSRRLYQNAGRLARAGGSLGALAWNLEYQATDEISRGRLGLAEAHAEEGCAFAAEVGQPNTACRNRGLLALCAAIRGRPEAGELAAEVLAEASERRLADATAYARRALGLVELAAGRHGEAARHFEAVGGWDADQPSDLAMGLVPDLVEALVRAGEHDRAAVAATRYARWTEHTASPELGALTARCRALVCEDGAAHYAESLRLHALADAPLEQARTELLLGEQLRRDRRRSQAQQHLRGAAETFRRIGAVAWADRALGELRATGESARTPEAGALTTLTPQELRIALAVGEGLTNREIAAQLFLSPRTVDYHLRKVFQKAGLTSRAELMRMVLAERPA
ncbi:helix-turn-helix transcriptional regulator [Nonomuraea diastatica]|uniref:helix-turn-helix transcriptional regulator n=1 Tax=Nonomuraea diastatica TaxID=1848329 RepID=UPI00140A345F|nr:LuxR family transcriptional regulator [Nonomuraea diastatica]